MILRHPKAEGAAGKVDNRHHFSKPACSQHTRLDLPCKKILEATPDSPGLVIITPTVEHGNANTELIHRLIRLSRGRSDRASESTNKTIRRRTPLFVGVLPGWLSSTPCCCCCCCPVPRFALAAVVGPGLERAVPYPLQ